MPKRDTRRPKRVAVGGQVAQVALSPSGRIFALTTQGKLACIDLMGR
ncbi:hypothetical protein SAMN05444166_1696 [Singulisphaera sp. GP187]|nr:hypothetical protein [Singulisphaera sp. GP187]SIN93794.1 hypothetical protein SAMN05444166_1696 [Singulisphaera sp. GP187]